jgi:hypothetical protein
MKRLTEEQRAERHRQYLVKQEVNRLAVMERRRARYAAELERLESCVELYTVSDADYRLYFRGIPRWAIDEKRQNVQERLDWVRAHCGLTDV